MASAIPRVASSARPLLSRSVRGPSAARIASTASRVCAAQRTAFITHAQRRYASGTPHYDPAPPQIETVLKENEAEPHSPEEWKEIGQSALRDCATQAERDAVQEYITNAMKPTLTDEEIIAVASQVGVSLTTPEHLVAAHAVFKNLMKAATLAEVETLFKYFEKTGGFPTDIKNALNESFTKALAAPPVADHGQHDDHGHAPSPHGAEHAKESFGVGWYFALGVIPFSWILFTLTRSKSSEDDKPYLTRLIHKYDSWQEEWRYRNELHTKSVEQAGFDRLLFRHARTSEGSGTGRHDVRFEDHMNQGPPINVASGSYVNLDKVIDHYKKINEETEQRRQEIEKYYQEKDKPITSVSKKKLQVS